MRGEITYQCYQEYIKEGEGECRTAYMLCIIAVCKVHDVCDDIAFIQILAVATISFILAGLQLLIEGGSYSRAAFINLERHFRELIDNKQQNQAKDVFCHVFASN